MAACSAAFARCLRARSVALLTLGTAAGLLVAAGKAVIIALTVPFAVVGMTVGLLAFGFVALLGAMSLSGMIIKNAIVLLDEVNINFSAGKSQYDAVIYTALSRLRTVFLAAATAVLGVVPLLPDVFWVGLALPSWPT